MRVALVDAFSIVFNIVVVVDVAQAMALYPGMLAYIALAFDTPCGPGWTWNGGMSFSPPPGGDVLPPRTDWGVLYIPPDVNPNPGDTYYDLTVLMALVWDGTGWRGSPSADLLFAFPGFGVDVVVPSYVKARQVFGTFEIAAAAGVTASLTVEVTPSGGPASIVVEQNVALGLTTLFRIPFSFVCIPGDTYQFLAGGGVGVTENVVMYSFADQT